MNNKFSKTIYLKKPKRKEKVVEEENIDKIFEDEEVNKDYDQIVLKDGEDESEEGVIGRNKVLQNKEEIHEDVVVYEKGKEVKVSDYTETNETTEIIVNESSSKNENQETDSIEDTKTENIKTDQENQSLEEEKSDEDNTEENEENVGENDEEEDEDLEVEISKAKYTMRDLLAHQKDAIKNLEKNEEKSIYKALMVMPINSGKIFTNVYYALSVEIANNKKVLWISSQNENLDKVSNCINELSGSENIAERESFTYRIISKNHDKLTNLQNEDDFVVIDGSLLNKDEKNLKDWIKNNKNNVCVIIDEASFAISNVYKNIIYHIENTCDEYLKLIGLTTDIRKTDESEIGVLDEIFTDGICFKISLGLLINREIIKKPINLEYNTNFYVDCETENINEIISKSDERNNFLVKKYVDDKNLFAKTIILANSKDQASSLKEMLFENEIKSEILTKSTTEEEFESNKEKVDLFESSQIDILIDTNFEISKFNVKNFKTVFLAKFINSKINLNNILKYFLKMNSSDDKNEVYFVNFIDEYKENTSCLSPSNVLDIYVGKDEKNYYKDTLAKSLIPNKLVYEYRKINNINSNKLTKRYVDLVPFGSYVFDLFENENNDIKICEVLVFENLKEAYKNAIENLEEVFNNCEIKLNETVINEVSEENVEEKTEEEAKETQTETTENIEETTEENAEENSEQTQEVSEENLPDIFRLNLENCELDKLYEYVLENYFKEFEICYGVNKNDLFDIFNYFYKTNKKPSFYLFKERPKYDLKKVCDEIIEYDFSSKKEYEFVSIEWNDEFNGWQKYFNYNKGLFFKEVRRVKDSLYDEINEKGENVESKDYKKLSLIELYKLDKDYYLNLKQKVFEKHKHKEGYYEADNFKSMYKKDFEIEYIKSISEGGTTTIENLKLVPRIENIDKNKETDLDYLKIKIESVFSNKRYNKALKHLNEYLKVKKDTWAYNLKGDCYLNLKKYEEALFNYYESIELDEFNEDANFKIAYIYQITKKQDLAKNYYDKTTNINDKNANSYHNNGLIFMEEKNNEVALKYFDKFLEVELDDEVLNLKGDILCDMGKFEEGSKCYDEAIKVCSDKNYLVKIFNKFGKKNKPRK